ncbi:MAG: ferrous iron transporter B, partial [Clostridia bacterium]|nr:ferrous iron transporter B [Clostridia bacterium]
MDIKIALAGNPNCGKTTLFNELTGSNQFVGNWPGVTVEKKEGKLKKHDGVIITDLPGIYSLSPYTLEEVVARNYLVEERPDAILNIVDGSNIERNLYLTTQLTELGIPVVVAINMMDIVRKNGDKIDIEGLSKAIGCRVLEVSAIKGEGVYEAVEAAISAVTNTKTVPQHAFSGEVEHALAHIEEAAVHDMPAEQQRWYAVKIFERDEKVLEKLKLSKEKLSHIEEDIKHVEEEFDDDAESIITNERYNYIAAFLKNCYKKKNAGRLTVSDKIDKVVTNRILALPIFAVIMFLVYFISVTTVGTWVTDFTNDGLFGDGWHLFGIGTEEYDQAITEYANENIWTEELTTTLSSAVDAGVIGAEDILGAVEDGDFGAFDEAYGSFGESLTEKGYDISDIVDTAMEKAPDSSEYGKWVPGVPVLVEGLLEDIGCAEWLKGLILDG